MIKIVTFFLLLFTTTAFANLPELPLQFPRDEAAHYANVPYPITNLTEWWYFNGELVTPQGRKFGYSISTFNITMDIFGNKVVIPFYTLQLTDVAENKVYGNAVSYAEKDTHFATDNLNIVLGKHDLNLREVTGAYILNTVLKSKDGTIIKLALQMMPIGKILMESKDGLVPVGKDYNAYYYAHTRMTTAGSISIGNDNYAVVEKQSSSWMEHVWGDFMLSPVFPWVSNTIRLDNGVDINIVDTLNVKTKEPLGIDHANIRFPDGSNQYINSNIKVAMSNEKPYPYTYEISIEPANIHLRITSLADHQDLNGWWEGFSQVQGIDNGRPVTGFSYAQNLEHF